MLCKIRRECCFYRVLCVCKWIMIVLAVKRPYDRTNIPTHTRTLWQMCTAMSGDRLLRRGRLHASKIQPRSRVSSATGLCTVSKHLATVFLVLRPLAIFIPVTFLRLTCIYWGGLHPRGATVITSTVYSYLCLCSKIRIEYKTNCQYSK